MKMDIILGVLRHVLTGLGGVLVAKGLADDSQIGEAAGALCTLIGFGWSVYHKKQVAAKLGLALMGLGLMGMMGMMSGCTSATATRSVTTAAGITTADSITVRSFLSSISNGVYGTTNADGTCMSLSTSDATPDQQSIAILAGGLVDLGKVGLGMLSKAPTNLVPAVVTSPASPPAAKP